MQAVRLGAIFFLMIIGAEITAAFSQMLEITPSAFSSRKSPIQPTYRPSFIAQMEIKMISARIEGNEDASQNWIFDIEGRLIDFFTLYKQDTIEAHHYTWSEQGLLIWEVSQKKENGLKKLQQKGFRYNTDLSLFQKKEYVGTENKLSLTHYITYQKGQTHQAHLQSIRGGNLVETGDAFYQKNLLVKEIIWDNIQGGEKESQTYDFTYNSAQKLTRISVNNPTRDDFPLHIRYDSGGNLVALESKAQKTIYQYAPNGVITHAKTSDTKGSLSVKYYYTFYE